jgi:hypothetical protein
MRDSRWDADDLSGSHDPRLLLAEKERRRAFLNSDHLLDRVSVRLLRVTGCGVDEHNTDAGAVLSAAENPAILDLGELVLVADAQVVTRLLQLVLDRLPVKPRLSSRWDPVRAQRVQHSPIVGVARREIEHELRRHTKPRQARVVDRTAKLIATCFAG